MQRLALTLTLTALLGPSAGAGERIELVLRPEARVEQAWITLADIADLDAVRRLDADLSERLAGLRLAPVRAGAGPIVLKRDEVAAAVRRAALGRIGKISVADGSVSVRVTPQLRAVSVPALVDAAVTQFLERCGEVAERCTADVDANALRPADVPAGRLTLDAVLPPGWPNRPGTTNVKVRMVVDDVVVGAVRVPVNWRGLRRAWALEAAVEPGRALRRRDVSEVRVEASRASTDALAYDANARVLRPTELLERGSVIAIPKGWTLAEFRAGDEVPVSVALGDVRVTRPGAAVQDGRPGARAFVRFEGTDLISGHVAVAREREAATEGSAK